jgi:hypothetical protein
MQDLPHPEQQRQLNRQDAKVAKKDRFTAEDAESAENEERN